MYFLSTEEEYLVRRGLRAEARRQPVADELRGWSWPEPPLRPIYGETVGVLNVAFRSDQIPPDPDAAPADITADGEAVTRDALGHRVVADVVQRAKELIYRHGAGCLPYVERLADGEDGAHAADAIMSLWSGGQTTRPRGFLAGDGQEKALWAPMGSDPAEAAVRSELRVTNGCQEDRTACGPPWARTIRGYEVHRVVERVASVLSSHRSIGADALVALALPVSMDVAVEGRCLGLHRDLCISAVSFPEMIVYHLRIGRPHASDRLVTTAFALALESRYETACDLGCLTYVDAVGGRPVVEHDLHVIGDELRLSFVEERDEYARQVSFEAGRAPVVAREFGRQSDDRNSGVDNEVENGAVRLSVAKAAGSGDAAPLRST